MNYNIHDVCDIRAIPYQTYSEPNRKYLELLMETRHKLANAIREAEGELARLRSDLENLNSRI